MLKRNKEMLKFLLCRLLIVLFDYFSPDLSADRNNFTLNCSVLIFYKKSSLLFFSKHKLYGILQCHRTVINFHCMKSVRIRSYFSHVVYRLKNIKKLTEIKVLACLKYIKLLILLMSLCQSFCLGLFQLFNSKEPFVR